MKYKSFSNKKLLQENTLVCAYICYLMEEGYNGSLEPLLDISTMLEKEIQVRKISNKQIERFIQSEHWSPHEQVVIGTFIFPESDLFNIKIGQS